MPNRRRGQVLPTPTPSPGRRLRSEREAEAYLLSFVNYEALARYRPTTRTHDLRRFAGVLRELGWDPGLTPAIHVGGTNAKGTVSHLLERILRAGGLTTGLYTSPHLLSFRERIRLDGAPMGARDFVRGVERLRGLWSGSGEDGFRTTFENLTALAFLAFQESRVDRAVVEVGLGGRLDATNVLPPGPALLTPISLDHQHILGRTIREIAADKSKILKAGGRIFLMPQRPAARREIERRLRRLGEEPVDTSARVAAATVRVFPDGASFSIRGGRDYGVVRTRLLGAHQEENVAAAVAVAEEFLPLRGRRTAIRRGLSAARIAGRMDLREAAGIPILLDGGHNPAAGRALARGIARHFPGVRPVMVLGMAQDKDHRGFIAPLAPLAARWIICAAANPRAAPPARLVQALPGPAIVAGEVRRALERALAARPDLVVVTGSFAVAGEALEALGAR